MEEIKSIVDDIGIAALEANTKIAGLAVITESGDITYQTENFDLSNQTQIILDVMKGVSSYTLNNLEFTITEATSEGIISTNKAGMGHGIFVPFQGGILVAYAMPQANTSQALAFLKQYVSKLNGKV